jgi:hypothetical protein
MGTVEIRFPGSDDGSWWQNAPLAGGSAAGASASPLDPKARELAIRTVLGEAADEPDEGMAAVAAVIRNRVRSGRFGGSVPEVVLKPKQFEPWNTPEGRSRMQGYAQDSEPYSRAARAVDSVFAEGSDPTSGATHFYSPTAQAALGREPPAWAQGEPQNIGRHAFYAPEGRAPSPTMPTADSWWKSAPLVTTPAVEPAQPASAAVPGQPEASVNGRALRAAQDMPEPGAGEALGRAAAKGLTANFYDEMRGLMEAGGLNPNDPASLSALLKGAVRLIQSDPEAAAAYETATGREKARGALTQEQRPGLSIGGEIAGAIASPAGMIGRGAQAAAGLGGRMVQGLRQGATYGAIAGAGDGEGATGTATGAATGALTGAVLGGVIPVGVKGVEAVGRGIGAVAQPVINTVRGIRDPEGEAARRVTGAIARDYRAGQPGLSAAEYRAAQAEGQPASVMDLGGTTTQALARSAANTSPEGRGILDKAIGDRFGAQGERVVDYLNRSFHYPNAEAQQQALAAVAKTVNRPAYAKAYHDGASGVWDAELQALSQAPAVQDAVKAAIRQAQNRSAPQASNPNISARWTSQDGKPTLEFWDLVKRQVDQEINVAKRAGRNEDVAELTGIKQTIVGKLDAAVPSYAAARVGAAKAFDAEDALEAGQKFVASKMAGGEARRALGKMSPQERQLFQDGFVSEYVETLSRVPDRRDVLNKIANSTAAREKLEIAVGPQKAKELEAFLRVEGVMDSARKAVQGNSTTARQLTELGLAGGTYTVGTGGNVLDPNPTAMLNAALVFGAAKGKGAIDKRVAQKVAEMLTSRDPAVLTRGVQIVARQGRFLDSLRNADKALARSGAGQVEGIPGLQAAGIGRASEDQ